MTDVRAAIRLAGLRALGGLLGVWPRRTLTPDPSPKGRGGYLPPLPLGEGWGEGAEGWGEGAKRRRLVLIRPDHLGDVLLAAPTAQLLASALPGAQVDWLVGPWSAEVARRSGHAGEILTCEFPGFARRPKCSPFAPYLLLWRAARRLRRRRYDAALVLRPDHWWGALLVALAGIPRRFGFAVPECQPFLTETLPPPAGHALVASQDLGRLAARRLGRGQLRADLVDAYLSPSFNIGDEERRRAADLIAGAFGSPATPKTSPRPPKPAAGSPIIAIHPGTGAAIKNWPAARWAAVASRLQLAASARLILTGGPTERALVEEIAAQLPRSPLVLAGRTTLGELAAIFERCDLVVGGDSGPLHIAAAVGTPTLRLYGPTSTAIFGPWGDPAAQRVLQAHLPCQPCGNLVAPPCGAASDPPCLQAITVEQVASTALGMLADASTTHRQASTPSAVSAVDSAPALSDR